jgi:hypothetical protein
MSKLDDKVTEDEIFTGNAVSIDGITDDDFDVLVSEAATDDAEQILGDGNA